MGRQISSDFRVGLQFLNGASDPSGLNLTFELEVSRVSTQFDPTLTLPKNLRIVPTGTLQSVASDISLATIATLKKRLGIIRETRLRFLRPIYNRGAYRVNARIAADIDEGVVRLAVEFLNDEHVAVVDGEVQIFLLGAQQLRRMSPDGMIPTALQRFCA